MKLVKTTTLVFAEGRTERVYEIDLCEVGAGQFVVNFRYGKRGAPLKDGTKTVAPVAQAEAERVYDKLVQQQIEKGYVHEGAPRPAPPIPIMAGAAPVVAPGASFAAPRQRDKILERLAAAAAKASVRPPPAPGAAAAAPAAPAQEGVGGEVVSFSAQQGFGVVRLDSGQTMTFDVAITAIPPGGLVAGLRVRLEIGPSRIPGRLTVKALWREGGSRFPSRPVSQAPPARPKTSGGPLERMIWRAGELRIREAEPALLALVGTGGAMRDYCIAWSLGRIGTGASLDTLTRLYGAPNGPPHVARIATLALQALSDEPTRAEFSSHLATTLPPALQEALRGSDAAAFATALRTHLAAVGPDGWGVVDLLYAIDRPVARDAILAELREVPLTPPYFYFIRHVFKAAEYRRDALVFGLLAWRFEKTRANFSSANWSYRSGGRATPMAYGGNTRRYLRRRVWRTLRRAGQIGDVEYVKLAVGVLLPFTDADAVAPRESQYGASYDRFAPYWAFNGILYGNSPRYESSPNAKIWRVKRGGRVGGPPPAAREESFPKLWEVRPEGLMHLLAESECTAVHEFAAKAMRACGAFLEQLDVDDVIMLLGRPYDPTARLGLELAERRYDRNAPNMALLAGMARSVHGPARTKAFGWLDEQRARVLADGALVAELVVAPFADAREFARRLLRSSTLAADVASALVARVVAAMLALPESPDGDARARDATQTLVLTLTQHLGVIGPEVVRDLLSHPLSGVQELGAELLLRGGTQRAIPDEVMVAILHSPHENVRAVGMRLLGELPDDVLATMELLLVRLSTDKNADLRNASRPIVQRIAKARPMAGETIARGLLEALLRRKLPEGAPTHILTLLREDLFAIVLVLPTADVWRLLQSGSAHAQELGGLLLQSTPPDRLEIDQIFRLASHDILSVRQAAWAFYEKSLDRVRANMAEAARVLDAKWDDSRAFAFRFFRERIGAESYTADVLVTILDSVREDVQAFGRELTTKYFREEDGPALMTKLSEHPSVAVQVFTTNYLARYATDRPGVLEGLVPYFTSVLSRPNKGRVAKQRVLAFLEAEGAKNEEAARVVLAILHRVSASIAVELRSAAIAAMVAIHHAQPDVVLPLRFKEPPVRGAHGVPVRV